MKRVEDLIAESEIRDVHLRYCRGVDRMDWDLVRACYHPDATDDHGAFKGTIDEFLAWVSVALEKYEVTTHFVGNQLVEVSGDKAWAEHYGRIYHRRAAVGSDPAEDFIVNVRYVDAMELRSGQWRIARRVVIVDSARRDPVTAAWLAPDPNVSRKDRQDASYRR
jgi:3-phenylpropionate/cinnamic acid dioxygenase small subunit